MASGGTIMQRPEKAVEAAREDTPCILGIKGKSIVTPSSIDRSDTVFREPKEELSPGIIDSRPSSSNSSSEQAEPIGAIEMPEEGVVVLQTVMHMNNMLENQIQALRFRIDVEAKHHEQEKDKIIKDKKDKLDSKEIELQELRDNVNKKDEKIKKLVKEKEFQDFAIKTKMEEVGDLKKLVKQTEDYAERLQRRFSKLKDERDHLESDTVYKDQNQHITELKHEICHLKEKVGSMERELARAKNIMETQNEKMRLLHAEKNNVQSRFREELDKASRVMRQEVERMREVMKLHYEEMRDLRQQNQDISTDVRDIKDLLMKTQTPRQPPNNKMSSQYLDVNQFQSVPPKTPGPSPRRSMLETRTVSNLARNQVKIPARSSTGNMAQTKVTGQGALPLIPNDRDKKWLPGGIRKATTSCASPNKGNLRK